MANNKENGNCLTVEIPTNQYLKMTVKQQNEHIYRGVIYLNKHGSKWARSYFFKLLICTGILSVIMIGHIGLKDLGALLSIVGKIFAIF